MPLFVMSLTGPRKEIETKKRNRFDLTCVFHRPALSEISYKGQPGSDRQS